MQELEKSKLTSGQDDLRGSMAHDDVVQLSPGHHAR